MKLASKLLAGLALLGCIAAVGAVADEIILDDFDYEDEGIIYERYSNSGWLGSGEAYISDDSMDGSQSMELFLTFDGSPWGGGAVRSTDQEPFAFGPNQVVSYDIKGDVEKLSGDQAILVFQFRDMDGEVIRFLDYVGPKTTQWTTIKMPFAAFEEGPWDANPDIAADRENLVNWEFYVQGVGGDPVDWFESTIYLDNLKISDAVQATGGDRVIDDFEYASDGALKGAYASSGQLGKGTPILSDQSVEGSHALELALSFDGGPWGSAGARSVQVDPFSIAPDQVVKYTVKGDPAKLAAPDVLIVLLLYDSSGESFRYLDAEGPKSADWTTIEITHDMFQENPWDQNPDVAANRDEIVAWEFTIQGVGPNPVDPYETSIFIDDFVLTASAAPPGADPHYIVNRVSATNAPNVMDNVFDSVYAASANEISFWEDDTYSPVSEPYSDTRAYLLTDGQTLYCGMLLADPDTSTLTTDTANDTLTKWQVDSWEIVFAPNPDQIDGQNYVKFAGDSAGQWDDIYPDEAGGTDWSAPSFQSAAYIIDANFWAAEFSVDIADIQDMIAGNLSYGHIGIQVKDPALNFAFPNRASFGSRNAVWDLTSLTTTSISDWALFD